MKNITERSSGASHDFDSRRTMKSKSLFLLTLKVFLWIGSVIWTSSCLATIYIAPKYPTTKHNSTQILRETHTEPACSCVNCITDKLCGGLWHANRYPSMPSDQQVFEKRIHIVIAHCNKSLKWMSEYTQNFRHIMTIHVISKCGVQVEDVPENAIVMPQKNIGRNDHSFAYYITSVLPLIASDDDSIVVFLKDSMIDEVHQGQEYQKLDLRSLVKLASSENGFACGLSAVYGSTSAYHFKEILSSASINSYGKGELDYKTGDGVAFKSSFDNLGDFYSSLNTKPLSNDAIVPVCYGGYFAASMSNIYKQDMEVWKRLEQALSRGDNIQESHFAERSWARLLSTPLKKYQVEALLNHVTSASKKDGVLFGEDSRPDITFLNLRRYRLNTQQ